MTSKLRWTDSADWFLKQTISVLCDHRTGLASYIKFKLLRGIHKHFNDCVPPISEQMLMLHIVMKTFICNILQSDYIS